MSVFRCKMCGAGLDFENESNVVCCEYCGSKQTIPHADNEKKVNMFNRANKLRMFCEFDKANILYQNIISEFPDDAEAFWGVCLCKYGIEYIDDPKTGRKVPTLHRAAKNSILNDDDFNAAVGKADVIAREQYKAEAAEIDRINSEINEIAKREKPYDVFICYKETDESGERTKDSVRAQEIYDILTKKGYNVFFARITLEDKLGEKYEPYIFSALTSARVMLVVGTKSEYFTAVWVRNEWSRYLAIMEQDKSKKLFPCYCDMDAYDLPIEFKNLQAQDMSKIGFEQDLARNIEKLIPLRNASEKAQNKPSNDPTSLESMIANGNKLLEYGNYSVADEIFTNMTRTYPDDYHGWWGKILCMTGNFRNLEYNIDEMKMYYDTLKQTADENVINDINEELDDYFKNIVSVAQTEWTFKDYENALEESKQLITTNEKEKLEEKNKANRYASACEDEIADLMAELSRNSNRERLLSECLFSWHDAERNQNIIIAGGVISVIIVIIMGIRGIAASFDGDDVSMFTMFIPMIIFIVAAIILSKPISRAKNALKRINQYSFGDNLYQTLRSYTLFNKLNDEYKELKERNAQLRAEISNTEKELEENNAVAADNIRYYDSIIQENTAHKKALESALGLSQEEHYKHWHNCCRGLLQMDTFETDKSSAEIINRALDVMKLILKNEEADA